MRLPMKKLTLPKTRKILRRDCPGQHPGAAASFDRGHYRNDRYICLDTLRSPPVPTWGDDIALHFHVRHRTYCDFQESIWYESAIAPCHCRIHEFRTAQAFDSCRPSGTIHARLYVPICLGNYSSKMLLIRHKRSVFESIFKTLLYNSSTSG